MRTRVIKDSTGVSQTDNRSILHENALDSFVICRYIFASNQGFKMAAPVTAQRDTSLLTPVTLKAIDASTELPHGFMPFEEFKSKFNLGETSTEQSHVLTKNLSDVAKKDIVQALDLLLNVEQEPINGLVEFMPFITKFAPVIASKIKDGGRVFFVGSGSSGRVGNLIAAECAKAFGQYASQLRGILAGGDSTMIKPKENYEDSPDEGAKALAEEKLTPLDTVFLISASGSASFNEGCGHFAANQGADVFYFYNSKAVVKRTEDLFSRQNNPVKPLCIDRGAQAIAGSTRLQAATLTQCCLGALLVSALYQASGEQDKALAYPQLLVNNMKRAKIIIQEHLKDIATFCQIEQKTFSDKDANFRRDVDETNRGYVTFVAESNCMPEVLIDATETSPTFSTNAMLKETEVKKKRPEFAAYIVGEKDNQDAWKALMGRGINTKDIADTSAFILAKNVDGVHSYANRSTGRGNFVIAVSKPTKDDTLCSELCETLQNVRQNGADTGLIFLSHNKISSEGSFELRRNTNAFLCLEDIPYDEIGFSKSIILKLVLNLISNVSMTLMGKVEGNLMIDVRAANKKLIDRCMRLIKAVWKIKNEGTPLYCDDKTLYCKLAQIFVHKEMATRNTPPVVKIMLQMLIMKASPSDFDKVCEVLKQNNEIIQW